MKHLLTLFFMAALTSGAMAQPWLPVASGSTLFTGASFIDPNTGMVSGSVGAIHKTINGGSTWTPLTTGVSTHVSSVYMQDANNAYAVSSAAVLKTINGGTSWTTSTPAGGGATLAYIGTANTTDLYLCGYNGVLMRSTTAGASWTTLTSGTSEHLYGVYFTDALTGYACGNNGKIIKTINGGTSWSSLTTGTAKQMLSIWFTDANNGVAVGGVGSSNIGSILRTTNAGLTWTEQVVPNNYFGGVQFISPLIGFIAGGDVTANTSTILKTSDGGANWIAQTSTGCRQYGISISGFGAGYSSGLCGNVLKVSNINIGIEESTLDASSISISPNPFNSSFNLNFNTNNHERVKITLLNVVGAELEVLMNEEVAAGDHSIKTKEMINLPAGAYFVQFQVGSAIETKKIIKSE